MRVLHVSDFYLPRMGGVERVIQGLAQQQLQAGDQPLVLTRRLAQEPAHEWIDGVRVDRLAPRSARAPLHYIGVVRAARSWARSRLEAVDLVHAHLSLTSLGPVLEAARHGVPVVASFYGPWQREFLVEHADAGGVAMRHPGLARLARPAMAALMRWCQTRVLDHAKRLILLSRYSAGQLAEFGYNGASSRCRQVPGGVDTRRFRPSARSSWVDERLGSRDRPLLLSVRRLVPRMGLELLLAAFRLLRRRYPTAELAIGGEGPLKARLQQEAQALEGVSVLGAVPEDALPALYARADLSVMPTRALEGFGLPVLESWACGTPVVATPVGSLPELVGQSGSGWLAGDTSPRALAECLERALGAPAAGMPERLRQLAESHSWSRISQLTRQVYLEATEERA